MMTKIEQPIAARFWWLKRISTVVVIVLMAVGLLRWWWGQVADARLQATIEQIQARGEPILPEDFATEPVADEDNAAYYLRAALAARRLPENGDPTIDPSVVKDDRAYLADNAEAIALVRRARDCTECNWGVQLTSPAFNFFPSQLNQSRQLAHFLKDAQQRQHAIGNDAGAIEISRDMLHLARAVEQPSGVLIGHLIAISIRTMNTGMLEELTNELNIAPRNQNDPATRDAATRQQVHQLITQLLDDQSTRQGFVDAMQGERVFSHDTFMQIVNGKMNPSTLTSLGPTTGPTAPQRAGLFVIRPLLIIDLVYTLDYETAYANAAGQAETLTEFKAIVANAVDEQALNQFDPRQLLSGLLLPAMGHFASSHFRERAQARMAATALAIRLYEIDHGRRPEALDQLAPDYLPQVPRDPFADDDRALGYKPQGVEPTILYWAPDEATKAKLPLRPFALLYSVGPDGRDDGGLFYVEQDGELNTTGPHDDYDLVFLLDKRPPLIEWEAAELWEEDELEEDDLFGKAYDGEPDKTNDQRNAEKNQSPEDQP